MKLRWEASALGLAVGLLVGSSGVGGAALTTPTLIYAMGVPANLAIGTDLVFCAITKWLAGLGHLRQGHVDQTVLARLCLGSLPASLAALALVHVLAEQRLMSLDVVQGRLLGAVLILAAVAIVYQVRRRQAPVVCGRARRKLVLSGALVGLLVGLTSVGSGSVLVALLALSTSLEARRVVGTDVVHAAVITTLDGAYYWRRGSVDVGLLLSLLAGSAAGAQLGVHVSRALPERWLRASLAGLLLVAGLHLL